MNIPVWTQIVESFAAALRFFNEWLGSPGLAIILFTLLLQAITLPLTRRSARAAREQQDAQAQIAAINRRWKRNEGRRQAELSRLAAAQGRGLLAAYLPALLQFLIFLALFQALAGLVQQEAAFAQPFLWVPNLAQPDPLFVWPLLAGLVQVAAQWLARRQIAPPPRGSQAAWTQRIMQLTPLYLVIVYAGLPAGTVIYWTVSGICRAAQTYFLGGPPI